VARISEHARVCVTRCAMSPGHEARVMAMHTLCDKIDLLRNVRGTSEFALNRRASNQPSDLAFLIFSAMKRLPLMNLVGCLIIRRLGYFILDSRARTHTHTHTHARARFQNSHHPPVARAAFIRCQIKFTRLFVT